MSDFPDGKPVQSELLSDGRTQHLMPDGRRLTVPAEPSYILHYLSTWIGAEPGDTYEIPICIIGTSTIYGFFEVWNYEITEARNYRFDKTEKIVHTKTGSICSADDIRIALEEKLARESGIQRTPESFAVILDIETTGVDRLDEPISIGLILVELDASGRLVREVDRYHGLREPTVPITQKASDLHGLTISDLRGKSFDLDRIESILSRAQVGVAHNAEFDCKMLATVRAKPLGAWRCSYLQFPWLASHGRSLDGACKVLEVERPFPHSAIADCEALLNCLLKDAGSRTYFAALLAEESLTHDDLTAE